MPELPEVSITAERLNQYKGWNIIKIKQIRPLRTRFKGLKYIYEHLPLFIKSVKNKGKQIYFDLESKDNTYRILNHMNLDGFWTVNIQTNYTRTSFVLKNKRQKVKLYYNDQLMGGSIDFHTIKASNHILNSIAYSIHDGLSRKDFVSNMLRHPRSMVFAVIMDQHKVLSGVGNYIANESLYRAKIAPRCHIGNLSVSRLGKLYKMIRYIIYDSYNHHKNKGSDDNWYKSYQKYMLVYKKSEDINGYKVINDKVAGRTTYWVKEIQTRI